MIGLRLVLGTLLSTTLLWDVVDSRPAAGFEDFSIQDEFMFSDEGSGRGKTVELESKVKGIQMVGSGDDENSEESGSASGDEDSEEDIDLGSVSPDIIVETNMPIKHTSLVTATPTIGSEDKGSGHPPLPYKSTEIPASYTSAKDIKIETVTVITATAATEAETTVPTSAKTITKLVSTAPVDKGSGHPPLPPTTATDVGDLMKSGDGSVVGSGSGSGSGELTMDDADEESSSTSFVTGIFASDSKSSSEFPVTVASVLPEEEEDEGSTDKTDFSIDQILANLTSESGSGTIVDVYPPKLSSLPDSGTSSPDIEITEEFLPVTNRKSTSPEKFTTSPLSPTTTLYVDTKTLPPPVIELTLGRGVEVDNTLRAEVTTLQDTPLITSSEHTNHSGKIHGRRRKPGHSDATDIPDGEVSIGAISEGDEEKKDKQVSYYAVIAAALICAIVFFILGYITSKLKNRRGALQLPRNKEKMNLESSADAGNGSALLVYRDTNPDKYNSVPGEVGGDKNLAEVHPKPKDLNASDNNVASQDVPMTDMAPGTDGNHQPVSDGDRETRVDEMKYIDETDEELEAAVTSPLLEEEEASGADRGDLASQVLNTVDKNLNAISENDRLLPPSSDSKTSNSVDTIEEASTR